MVVSLVNMVIRLVEPVPVSKEEQLAEASQAAADLELANFLKEIRNKKAALLREFDNDLLVIDREVGDILKRIKSECEGVYIEQSTLRIRYLVNEHVNDVRDSLNSRSEYELRDKMDKFTAELESSRMNMISTPNVKECHGFSTQCESQANDLDQSVFTKDKEPIHESPVEQPQQTPQQRCSDQLVEQHDTNEHNQDKPTDDGNTVITPGSSGAVDGPSSGSFNGPPNCERKKRSRPGKAKRARMARRREEERNQNRKAENENNNQFESDHRRDNNQHDRMSSTEASLSWLHLSSSPTWNW